MPSARATASTSSTVASAARCQATAASRELSAAIVSQLNGSRFDSHPPLRPDAPKPAKSRSRTTIRSDGSRRAR
jgi:hypothetical protein